MQPSDFSQGATCSHGASARKRVFGALRRGLQRQLCSLLHSEGNGPHYSNLVQAKLTRERILEQKLLMQTRANGRHFGETLIPWPTKKSALLHEIVVQQMVVDLDLLNLDE